MGVRADGTHVFGVIIRGAREGEELLAVVEATGYCIAPTDEGELLTFSTADGAIVEQYQPGTWQGVQVSIPGVDAPQAEEAV